MNDMKRKDFEQNKFELQTQQQDAVNAIDAQVNNSTDSSSDIAATATTRTNKNKVSAESAAAFVLRTPRSNSKLILQNMEEVLNSVKKKHRAKHKRKRELKKLAQMEAAAVEEQLNTLEVSAVKPKRSYNSRKKPLQVTTQENQEVSNANGNSILHHFKRTPKKNELKQNLSELQHETEIVDFKESTTDDEAVEFDSSTPKQKTNAFEVMMNARNKSMGGNTTGKEVAADDSSKSDESIDLAHVNKRKLLLQSWAERKGAKRKCEEESRALYVEEQLMQRTKRLKKMFARIATLETSQTSQLADDSSLNATTKAAAASKTRTSRRRNNNINNEIVVAATTNNRASSEPAGECSSSSARRARGTNNNMNNKTAAAVTTGNRASVEPAAESSSLSARRARRACTIKKTNYVEDEVEAITDATESVVVAKNNDVAVVEIIDLDDSNSDLKSADPKQLAPLFRRSTPKTAEDLCKMQARRDFLQSGVPDIIRQEQTRLKQWEQEHECCWQLFPSISHVQQLETQLHISNHKKQLKLRNADIDSIDKQEAPIILLKNCKKLQMQAATLLQCRANVPLPFLPNKRLVAKAWKLQYERFPTFKCYNQLREKYRYFNAIDTGNNTEQVSESLMVTCVALPSKKLSNSEYNNGLDDYSQPPATAPNGELLFTDKYKPLLYEQVLVNLTPVAQLRDFLANWCITTRNNNMNFSDVDDASYDCLPNSNTVVLLGPKASGKTNAVFALANELNFNVLEINAGMKRTGKRLVQELQEATQSHQIRSKQPQITLCKRTADSNSNSSSSTALNSNEERKSLILIEDADIAFEQIDAGFIDAIYTLAAASKRPVIVVASNPHCLHLQRLMQQRTINFTPAHTLSISRYLAVLSLIENCPVSIDDIVSLYLYNGMDMRRTLLELQLFVQSGGDIERLPAHNMRHLTQQQQQPAAAQENSGETQRLQCESNSDNAKCVENMYTHQTLFDFYSLDQNIHHRIPYPIDFSLLDSNMSELMHASALLAPKITPRLSTCSPKKTWLQTSQVKQCETDAQTAYKSLCDFYENISVAALLDAQDNQLKLSSPELSALAPRQLAADLTHALVERAVEFNLAAETHSYNLFHTPKKTQKLSGYMGISNLRSRRAKALDWEPTLRSICRFEKERAIDERQSMRFYHYLRSSCSNGVNNFSTEHFDRMCNILQTDKFIEKS